MDKLNQSLTTFTFSKPVERALIFAPREGAEIETSEEESCCSGNATPHVIVKVMTNSGVFS